MKTLVVYYSRSGRTRRAAERLAAALGADREEIQDLENHQGLIGFFKAGHQGMSGKSAQIGPVKADVGAYDLVVVGTPVWAGRMSSPVRAFLTQYGSRIKHVAYLLTRADRRNEYLGICTEMDELIGKTHLAAKSLCSSSRTFLEEVDAFAAGLGPGSPPAGDPSGRDGPVFQNL